MDPFYPIQVEGIDEDRKRSGLLADAVLADIAAADSVCCQRLVRPTVTEARRAIRAMRSLLQLIAQA